MHRLGYTDYVAQGGDLGAAVTDAMGREAPEGLLGIHRNLLAGAIGRPDFSVEPVGNLTLAHRPVAQVGGSVTPQPQAMNTAAERQG